ncbi:3-keto-disaccharide hydrolase [Sphingobium sp. YR768]|uniref:3-keto-disaccharide hydrolase n=1 Tax=Sphingobium sp. YR768 TaxID=1884365 RepID=UPI0008D7DBE4|nr:DUF1080 domain-containing protein [Sphingobium sp. YR768]SES18878.1 protein of unknown function [Sphingobium sp. YR768]
MSSTSKGNERLLFDGQSLNGWRSIPRIYGDLYPGGPTVPAWLAEARGFTPPADAAEHPAHWFVEDGCIIGEQNPPGSGYGGYLITEDTFGDFELSFEARPDFPADTGIMIRRQGERWEGFQVLLDHRDFGGIGGFFGNGLASFAAVPFAIRGQRDADGVVVGLEADDPATSLEPVTEEKIRQLSHAAEVEDFLRIWKWNDWNRFRIRCVGSLPVITTWINDLKVAEVDTATISWPNYDPKAIHELLGDRGHIALEVHDNDPYYGENRWGRGAQCRWRDLRVVEL